MAEKDTRTYVRVHDGLPDHPKIIAAGGEAAWLYICGLAYCSRQLTDGVIPKGLVPRLTDSSKSEALASALLRVGLWHGFGHDCQNCPRPPTTPTSSTTTSPTSVPLPRSKSSAPSAQPQVAGVAAAPERSAERLPQPKQTTKQVLQQNRSKREAKSKQRQRQRQK